MNTIVDSRRLMGPNLYSSRMGAALEVSVEVHRLDLLVESWKRIAHAISIQLGWPEPEVQVRKHRGVATLFLSAPIDVLMTATEVAEQAWMLAEQSVSVSEGSSLPLAPVMERLIQSRESECREHLNLIGIYDAAIARKVLVTFDDELLTVGSGAGARSWPLGALPDVDEVPWSEISDIPIALVTGSNGKTTTTRLVAAMARASGGAPGWCCSDGVWIGGEQVEYGDFSGPVGARTVLRGEDVDVAILECARGGMLRRGLAVSRADAAIITNIAADHFGEYGIETLDDLTDAKRIVERVLSRDGWLVLNADDPQLAAVATTSRARVALFASGRNAIVDAHVAGGGTAAAVHEGRVVLHHERVGYDVGSVDEMPLTMRGAAPHNIQNILGAVLLAHSLGTSLDAMRRTLATFGASNEDNPGRLQRYAFGGVAVLVDYAHNPDGLAALCATARSIPAHRRLLLLGQAGNRDDEEIRDLARVALGAIPFDHVIIKEELKLLRGRAAGDVPRILLDELARLGVSGERVETTQDEVVAMRRAFEWSRVGDLLVCPIHVDKAEVLAWLGRVADTGWTPGAPLPE
jgi:cyanophycin synthetase